jgi:ketosteroid isomerase-like protein
MTQDTVAEITQLENARGAALMAADWPALAALIADDVVHIHANGHSEDKVQYLSSVQTKLEFIKVKRVSLYVRCAGNVAVATGVLDQTVRIKEPGTVVDMHVATTQTWIRQSDGHWAQSSFQATNIA